MFPNFWPEHDGGALIQAVAGAGAGARAGAGAGAGAPVRDGNRTLTWWARCQGKQG